MAELKNEEREMETDQSEAPDELSTFGCVTARVCRCLVRLRSTDVAGSD